MTLKTDHLSTPAAYSSDLSGPDEERPPLRPQPASSPPAPSSTSLLDLITVLAEKADPLVTLVTATVDKYQKGEERKAKFQVHMAWVAVLVVLSIVGVATLLTYVGKIDGSTFAFLLGLIVGYVLTFIRDSIKSPVS